MVGLSWAYGHVRGRRSRDGSGCNNMRIHRMVCMHANMTQKGEIGPRDDVRCDRSNALSTVAVLPLIICG